LKILKNHIRNVSVDEHPKMAGKDSKSRQRGKRPKSREEKTKIEQVYLKLLQVT
jgi:hypothetical protein